MNRLIFEKVGDINTPFPYLCVYFDRIDENPFLDIMITEEEQLEFVFYAKSEIVKLNKDQLKEIFDRGLRFLQHEIADHIYYQKTEKLWAIAEETQNSEQSELEPKILINLLKT